jgi:transcriptional regulator with XRE-family HTH domain
MAQKFLIDSAWFFARLKENGYSLRGFALAMDMDPSAVSRMFNGQRSMSAGEQDKVAALLRLPLSEVAAHRGAKAEGFGEAGQAEHGASQAPETGKRGEATPGKDGVLRDPIFGCMVGTMTIPDDLDLTAPADPDWGKVYDDD